MTEITPGVNDKNMAARPRGENCLQSQNESNNTVYPWVCYLQSKQSASWKEASWEELRDTEKGDISRTALAKGKHCFLPRARNLGENILESLF